MPSRVRLWVVACAALSVVASRAEPPASAPSAAPATTRAATTAPATRAEIDQAISELSDASYPVRQSASERLFRAGPAVATAALEKAAASPDPEVSARARHVLDLFSLGLFPQTPHEVLDLVQQYTSTVDAPTKLTTLNQISRHGAWGAIVLYRLAQEETEEAPRAKAVELSRSAGAEVTRLAAARVAQGDAETAERVLTFMAKAGEQQSARNLAALLLDRHALDAVVADFERAIREQPDATPKLAPPLGLMHRADGHPDRAIAAVAAHDPDLASMFALEAGDWRRLADLQARVTNPSSTGRRTALVATGRRLSGDRAGFDAAMNDLAAGGAGGDLLLQAMALNDRTADAIRLLQGSADGGDRDRDRDRALPLLIATARYDELPAPPDDDALSTVAGRRLLTTLVDVRARTGHYDEAARRLDAIGVAVRSNPEFEAMTRLCHAERDLSHYDARWEPKVRAHALVALEVAARDRPNLAPLMAAAFPDADGELTAAWWSALSQLPSPEGPEARLDRAAALARHELGGTALAKLAEDVAAAHPFEPGDAKGRVGVLRLLADALRADGQNALADEYVDKRLKVMELMMDWAPAALYAAETGRWDRCATNLARAESTPANAWLRGLAMTKSGKADEGRAAMADAVHRAMADDDTLVALGQITQRVGQRDAARELYRRMQRLAAPGQLAYCLACQALGNDASDRHDWAEAAEQWQRFALTPLYRGGGFTSDVAYLELPKLVHQARARAAAVAGRGGEAVDELRQMLAIWPLEGDRVIDTIRDAQSQHPGVARALFDVAAQVDRDLIQRYPDDAELRNNFAWTCARCGYELDEALAQATRAVALEPRSANAIDTLAEVSFRKGDRAKAVELMKQCEALEPHQRRHRERREAFEKGNP